MSSEAAKKRVEAEFEELWEKLGKLRDWISRGKADDLLIIQENVMTAYANILRSRLANWKD